MRPDFVCRQTVACPHRKLLSFMTMGQQNTKQNVKCQQQQLLPESLHIKTWACKLHFVQYNTSWRALRYRIAGIPQGSHSWKCYKLTIIFIFIFIYLANIRQVFDQRTSMHRFVFKSPLLTENRKFEFEFTPALIITINFQAEKEPNK